MTAPTVPQLLSTPGKLVFSFNTAQGFLAIFNGVGMKGAKAIQLSRFKSIIMTALAEIDKERNKIILNYADTDTVDGEVVVRRNTDGSASFCDQDAERCCMKELNALVEETPILFNLGSPQTKIAAEKVYGILTGDDCPDIGSGSWVHDFIVRELSTALEKQD